MPKTVLINLADAYMRGENVKKSLKHQSVNIDNPDDDDSHTGDTAIGEIHLYNALHDLLAFLDRNDESMSQKSQQSEELHLDGTETLYIIAHGLSNVTSMCYYETRNKKRVPLCSAEELAKFFATKIAKTNKNAAHTTPIKVIFAVCYGARTTQKKDHWRDLEKSAFRHTYASRLAIALGRELSRSIVLTAFTGNVIVNKKGIIEAEDEFDTALSNKVDNYNQEMAEIAETIYRDEGELASATELNAAHTDEGQVQSGKLNQRLLTLSELSSALELAKQPQQEAGKVQFKYKPEQGVKVSLLFKEQALDPLRTFSAAQAFIEQTEANPTDFGTKSEEKSEENSDSDDPTTPLAGTGSRKNTM